MTARRDGSLLQELQDMIAENGPISVERYMVLALGHPIWGYYRTRDPFGIAGDFTTAPEVSQMFGELLGLWAAEVWHVMGRPDPVRLVELGPGRGTLMADALRAARALPPFRTAVDVHLVETSPVLRASQERLLAGQGAGATWHHDVGSVPDGPALVIANEFFDALPIRQLVRTSRGWCERLVGFDDAGELVFGLAAEPEPTLSSRAPEGAVAELCPTGQTIMGALADRLASQGGAMLAIDYGFAVPSLVPTFQAIQAHRFVDPLAAPGEADLTAHVDFTALAQVARRAGLATHGPVPQGRFLRSLGLDERAAALKRSATATQAAAIDAAVARLAGPDPGMGDLFKVLAVNSPNQPVPPGFASEFAT